MRFLTITALLLPSAVAAAAEPAPLVPELDGVRATLHAPVLVARRKEHLWFPVMHRLSDGSLLTVISDYADVHHSKPTALIAMSTNGGKTWSHTKPGIYGGMGAPLPSGDLLLLPYYYRDRAGSMFGEAVRVRKGSADLIADGATSVVGFPRPYRLIKPQLGPNETLGGFVTTGHVLQLPNNRLLTTMYGRYAEKYPDYEGDDRWTLVTVESADGLAWKYRSTIAGADAELPGKEGPNEADMARLVDGRLFCVFRVESGKPYGHCISNDDGQTWSKPMLLGDAIYSVKPSLAVLPNGTVALSGGRPGIFLWLNLDGRLKRWQAIDLIAHHNATAPKVDSMTATLTTSYTEVVAIDEHTLLVIYDRVPHAWGDIPPDTTDTNSIWTVRIDLRTDRQ